MGDTAEAAASHEHRTDGINEVVHGVDVRRCIRPVRHGARGCEESTEQHQTYYEEPHDEDGLLHRVAVVADEQSKRREEQRQQHGEQIDQPQRSLASDAIDGPSQQEAYRNDEQANKPVRDELSQMVPVSFSLTMFSAGRKPHISIMTMASRAGIMNTL